MYGLVKAFARCLSDKRAPEKIRHTLADLIGQRIFGIACGHPDCNDAEHLADDPIHKLLLGRDPVAGESLASQPTLSRFENAAGRGALYDMGCELAARVVERHRRRLGRVRRITIDLDPTDDPTHGSQQYSLFNGYYDNWCYLPLLAFLTFDREPEQYLCSAVLRHGKAVASEGGVALLARLLPLLRCAFPRARFLVRLDGGFASPARFDFLGAQPRLDYVVAMASNAVLLRHAEPAMLVARARSERSEQTEHLYMDTDYAAGTWSAARRVIIKAEVVRLGDREPRDNPRFVKNQMCGRRRPGCDHRMWRRRESMTSWSGSILLFTGCLPFFFEFDLAGLLSDPEPCGCDGVLQRLRAAVGVDRPQQVVTPPFTVDLVHPRRHRHPWRLRVVGRLPQCESHQCTAAQWSVPDVVELHLGIGDFPVRSLVGRRLPEFNGHS